MKIKLLGATAIGLAIAASMSGGAQAQDASCRTGTDDLGDPIDDALECGDGAEANAADTVAIGDGAIVDAGDSVAIGTAAFVGASRFDSVAIGYAAGVGELAANSTAVGERARVNDRTDNALALGAKSNGSRNGRPRRP